MTMLETIFLGMIQGLTEFLPISSSGHLVFFQNLLGFKEPEILLDSSLHLGTLLAVCLYFRNDIVNIIKEVEDQDFKGPHASMAFGVLLGTIPTGLMGLTLKEPFERFYSSVPMVGLMLIVTGIILMVPWIVNKEKNQEDKRAHNPIRDSLWVPLVIGIVQGFAIIPGISRAGITIACGLVCGLNRDLAGRFSFLLSIPMIVGWNFLNLREQVTLTVGLADLFVGFVTAALVGLLALKLLMGILKRGHLHYFAPYCVVIGLLVMVLV